MHCNRASGQRVNPTGHPALPGGLFCAIGNPTSDGTWTYTWEKGRQLKSMSNGSTAASFKYNSDGLRVQKTVGSVVTNYTLHGKNIVHMTQGSNSLHFFYDASNKPAIVEFNDTKYAYVHNLQGDVVAILDSAGNIVVQYKYDAWGRQISCDVAAGNSNAAALSTLNPFRYRGYVYDEEMGFYYLCSRNYVPSICRFLSPDEENNLGANNDFAALNLSAYCGCNPVAREDSNGGFWLLSIGAKMIGGVISQFVGDIIANVADGRTGTDIFERRSSWGDYIAAAITAVIPGSGVSGALVSNAISQTISIIEDAISGEDIDVVACLMEFGLNVLLDTGFEIIVNYVNDIIDTFMPKNYSSYAHEVRQSKPGLSKEQISSRMVRSVRTNIFAQDATEYAFGCIRASIAN